MEPGFPSYSSDQSTPSALDRAKPSPKRQLRVPKSVTTPADGSAAGVTDVATGYILSSKALGVSRWYSARKSRKVPMVRVWVPRIMVIPAGFQKITAASGEVGPENMEPAGAAVAGRGTASVATSASQVILSLRGKSAGSLWAPATDGPAPRPAPASPPGACRWRAAAGSTAPA